MKRIITYLFLLFTFSVFSQKQITLEECYQLVVKNYPLAKQKVIFEKQNSLDVAIINTEKLPKINLSAQATYQSDVIGLPIASIIPPNKDQYRTTISATQLIYAGGVLKARKEVKNASFKTRKKEIEVSLYQLKARVNQLYFSIILAQENRNLLSSKQKQLESKLKEVKSGIKNGMVLPISDKVIEVQLLKIAQQFVEIDKKKDVLIANLSALIGEKIIASLNFKIPPITTIFSSDLKRPELGLFQLKKDEIEASKNVLSKKNAPKVIGFVNGGYGNPGLNMLDNSFQPFYTVGVKLNWNVFDWNATKKQQEAMIINNEIIDNQTEVFKLNTGIALKTLEIEIEKMEAFIKTDKKMILLREDVLKSAASQLKNGVITATAYLTEVSNLYEDKSRLVTHYIQLTLAKANYNNTQGK